MCQTISMSNRTNSLPSFLLSEDILKLLVLRFGCSTAESTLHSHLQHLNNGFPQCVGPAGGGRPRGRSSGSPRPQEAPLRIRRIRLIRRIRRIRPRRIWLRRLWGLRRLRPWISLSVLRLLLWIDKMLKEQNILLLPKDFLGLEESETLKATEFIYFNDSCKVIQIKSDRFTSNYVMYDYYRGIVWHTKRGRLRPFLDIRKYTAPEVPLPRSCTMNHHKSAFERFCSIHAP
ncbi:uncharacterized protein LOC122247974 [Penaeus japonicus]|uniref:uncharacterized protein LOC122247974 n=1 Tax=Penaeus japonicus TaxID=27405 RepID=UPI001C713AC9|nr:uncharacterized protein LOC122247974 [Penaeus japonicus]